MREEKILQPNGETAAALLADPEAKIRGKQVSATQLARWHRERYIPQPVRHGLGRGRGTVSIYPPETREQLRRLCAFWSKERDAEKVQWRMWWAGYPVPDTFGQRWLSRAAAEWDEVQAAWQAAQTADERDLGLFPDAAGEALEDLSGARLRLPRMRRLRGRAGREGFATILRMLLETSVGKFAGYVTDRDTETSEEDERVVMKALGLDSLAQRDPSWIPPGMPGEMERGLQYLSQVSAETNAAALLSAATQEELERARDEVRIVEKATRAAVGLPLAGYVGRSAILFQDLDRMLAEMQPIDEALGLLLWLAMRRHGEGQKMDMWIQLFTTIDPFLAALRASLEQTCEGMTAEGHS
jgi:hypothetical protein